MATKAEKLAAARRKLKEYQGKTKDRDRLKSDFLTIDSKNEEIGRECESSASDALSTNVDNRSKEDNPSVNNRPNYYISEGRPNQFHLPLASSYFTADSSDNLTHSIFENLSCNVENGSDHLILDGVTPPITNPYLNGSSNTSKTDSPNFFNKMNLNENNDDTTLTNILEPLQQQLHSHVQTISALMSERNELNLVTKQTESILQEKNGEVDELQNRLSSAQDKITQLEVLLSNKETVISKIVKEKEELEKLCDQNLLDRQETIKKYEIRDEEYSELKQKLLQKSQENENLLITLNNTNHQLSLCQIKIQQLTSATPDVAGPQIMTLLSEKSELTKKVFDLETQLNTSVAENEQSNQNFQVYATQCNIEIQNLNLKITSLMENNNVLQQENENLNLKLNELIELKESKSDVTSQLNEQEILIKQLEENNLRLENERDSQMKELEILKIHIEDLTKELEVRDIHIREMELARETLLSETQVNTNNDKLLAAMESDKVAAARAVAQNVKLKQQLIELQEGFVKMSVGKLEVTEKLEHAEHVNQQLLLQLESRDKKCDHDHEEDEFYSNNVEELKKVIHQLENDKLELMNRLSSFTSSTGSRREVVERCEHEHVHEVHEDEGEHVQDSEATKDVLHKMEVKLRRTMDEIAQLDDEKQRLEHLVLQLQEETETIGEYVTLYQRQRILLNQRAKEKDEQLIQVSQDREELRLKLASLDDLVRNMLNKPNEQVSTDGEDSTAVKIRELITEIGSTNLVNAPECSFEHCSCCSGRLINI